MSNTQQSADSVVYHSHGNSPAAWTAVTIITIASAVMTGAVVAGSAPVFWAGSALILVGLAAGKIMAAMGMGIAGRDSDH